MSNQNKEEVRIYSRLEQLMMIRNEIQYKMLTNEIDFILADFKNIIITNNPQLMAQNRAHKEECKTALKLMPSVLREIDEKIKKEKEKEGSSKVVLDPEIQNTIKA